MLSGKYVNRFEDASHALPDGMHMNADYPFMLPKIVQLHQGRVTLKASSGKQTETAKIIKRKGREYCIIEMSSSFERMTKRRPKKFYFYPFLDESSHAIGEKDSLF